jgi:hypothetical protein
MANVNRNGDWLMGGIRVFDRIMSGQGEVTHQESEQVLLVFGYIRGVLDVEDQGAPMGQLSEAAMHKLAETDHSKVRAAVVDQLDSCTKVYAPLWNSDFTTTEMTADRMMGIVRVYLEKHPEKWG